MSNGVDPDKNHKRPTVFSKELFWQKYHHLGPKSGHLGSQNSGRSQVKTFYTHECKRGLPFKKWKGDSEIRDQISKARAKSHLEFFLGPKFSSCNL